MQNELDVKAKMRKRVSNILENAITESAGVFRTGLFKAYIIGLPCVEIEFINGYTKGDLIEEIKEDSFEELGGWFLNELYDDTSDDDGLHKAIYILKEKIKLEKGVNNV